MRGKGKIAKKDFVKWQTHVAEVFYLMEFTCVVQNIYEDISISDCLYEIAFDFHVNVTERNLVMDRVEEDEFSKYVVFEDNAWRVFLGYSDLAAIIQKYEELATLKKRPHIDSLSGLLLKEPFQL